MFRKVAAATGDISTFAGNGTAGRSRDGGPAIAAQLSLPESVAVDGARNLFIADAYIADAYNNVIHKVTAGGVTMAVQ